MVSTNETEIKTNREIENEACPSKDTYSSEFDHINGYGNLSESAGSGRMIMKQIKCPPESGKRNVETFLRKWIPAIETYGLDYTGIGDITGTTNNKKSKKIAIGSNRFFKINGKCGISSQSVCRNQDKYLYLRTYPTGKIPTCTVDKNGNIIESGRRDVIGGKGIIGGVLEDLSHLNVPDVMQSLANKGPYASDKCMLARLPVGDSLLKPSQQRANAEDAKMFGGGWWIEEHCVPNQPTFQETYGDEVFNIPYSRRFCSAKKEEEMENFQSYSYSKSKRSKRNTTEKVKKSTDSYQYIFGMTALIILMSIAQF